MKLSYGLLPLLTCCGMLAVPAHAFAGGQTWIVDEAGGPGSDFTEISDAVLVATERDLVLVRSGSYAGFTRTGQGLAVVADVGAVVSVTGASAIGSVPFGQSVVVAGLEFTSTSPFSSALALTDCAGPVWIQDAVLQAEPILDPGFVVAALFVHACASVTLVDSTVLALHSPLISGTGGRGVLAENSELYLFRSQVTGAPGTDMTGAPLPFPGAPGGAGIEVRGGVLRLDGASAHGGKGGDGASSPPSAVECGPGGPGGPGILLGTGSPLVTVHDSSVLGGPGGFGGSGRSGCNGGATGPPMLATSGGTQSFSGAARTHTATGVAREGDLLTLTFLGAPGDFVWWIFSGGQQPVFWPLLSGVILPASPATLPFLGTTSAAGDLTLTATLPDLGPGVEHGRLFSQGLHFDLADGAFHLSSGQVLVLLDGATP